MDTEVQASLLFLIICNLQHLQGCGTRVYGFSPKFQLYSATAVSVPSVTYQPIMHVFCKDAAWQLPNDGLPHYKDLPAEYGGSGEIANLQVS